MNLLVLKHVYFSLKDLILFCDACDKGFHMTCHKPAVTNKPKGKKCLSNHYLE